jgi:hypothetical protein
LKPDLLFGEAILSASFMKAKGGKIASYKVTETWAKKKLFD